MVFVNGQIPVFIAYWICTVIYARTLSGDINILYYVNYINIILHTKNGFIYRRTSSITVLLHAFIIYNLLSFIKKYKKKLINQLVILQFLTVKRSSSKLRFALVLALKWRHLVLKT